MSSIVDDAVRGEPSIITRYGKPQAVVVGFDDWQRLSNIPSFGRLLMSVPLARDDLPERDGSPVSEVEF